MCTFSERKFLIRIESRDRPAADGRLEGRQEGERDKGRDEEKGGGIFGDY